MHTQTTMAALDNAPMDAPTITPDTFFVVGVSGGKDSSAVLLWMVHESGVPKDRIIATFCDIGNDHEWTIQHVKLLSEMVHPIETIYPAMPFFELAKHKSRFPSTKTRFCTEHLKIYPSSDFIQRIKYEGKKVISVSGVRADESEDRKNLPEWDYSADQVRPHFPKFAQRGYVDSGMMEVALRSLAVPHKETKFKVRTDYRMLPRYGLSRVQFEGPWTDSPAANPRWASCSTHWIGSMHSGDANGAFVFDVNGGWFDVYTWAKNVVPEIAKLIKRSTGKIHLTHSIELFC